MHSHNVLYFLLTTAGSVKSEHRNRWDWLMSLSPCELRGDVHVLYTVFKGNKTGSYP